MKNTPATDDSVTKTITKPTHEKDNIVISKNSENSDSNNDIENYE